MDIIIPHNIASKIISKQRLMVYSTYFSLKSMYQGACIHNFKSRWSELSNKVGISSRTLRRHLLTLEQDGMISIAYGHLFLGGREKLRLFFDCEKTPKYFAYYINPNTKAKQIKQIIRSLVIRDSFRNQEYKMKNCKSEPYKGKPQSRSLDFIQDYGKLENRKTLSQFTFASKMGLKHASSGNYHFKKLREQGYLGFYKNDPVFITKGGRNALVALRNLNPSIPYFMDSKGWIYRRTANTIVLF